MLTDTFNKLFEQEVEARHLELKEELEKVSTQLENTEKELNELKTLNLTLKDKYTQLEELNTLKTLVTDVNISNILFNFNLKRNKHIIDGMHSEEIPTWFKLLFNYYEDRDRLFSIMDLFDFKYLTWAKEFKMPYDYNKEELKLFIDSKYDRYITNGEIFSENTGFFWETIRVNKGNTHEILTNRKAFSDYIPWQLVLSNPLWLEEDMFSIILKALKNKQPYSYYYYAIQNYLTISNDQIKALADLLPTNNLYDIHKKFIECNINIIRENEWLAERYQDVINDNQFSTFYYLNYPLAMQKVFIKKYKGYDSKFKLVSKMEINKEEKIKLLMEIAKLELN